VRLRDAVGAPVPLVPLRIGAPPSEPLAPLGADAIVVTTDASGTARTSLPAADYVVAVAGGLPRMAFTLDATAAGDNEVAGSSQATQEFTLRIRAPLRARGIVRDAGGRAVAGAAVLVASAASDRERGEVVAITDAQGHFNATLVCESPRIWSEPSTSGPSPQLALRPDAAEPIVLVVAAASARLRGRIRGADALPCRSRIDVAWFPAIPEAATAPRHAPQWRETHTGAFEFTHAPITAGTLVICAPNHAPLARWVDLSLRGSGDLGVWDTGCLARLMVFQRQNPPCRARA
jgi:hypothetical protein